MPEEIALIGGRVTPGVVRIGDTVRRPPGPNAEFVRRLLKHLSVRDFGAAPCFLGVDENGRETFSFIGGEVPKDLAFHDDHVLRQAASLIRRFHDLGAELVSAAAVAIGLETICHNDLSPCNFVFEEGRPVAILDFDAAAPGSRAADLGYASWLWLDLGAAAISATEQGRRLSAFVDGYGGFPRQPLVDALLQRQVSLICRARHLGDRELAEWAANCRKWTQDAYERLI